MNGTCFYGINSQSNYINNNDYELDNYYIYYNGIKNNNNNNTVLTNNFNNINEFVNFKNDCKNIKIGYTNNGTNLNISNLVFNYNEILNKNFNFTGMNF